MQKKICKIFTNMQKCSKMCENMQKCKKNNNNNMQIFKFFQADNRFQRSYIQIKLICYFMSYMQKS